MHHGLETALKTMNDYFTETVNKVTPIAPEYLRLSMLNSVVKSKRMVTRCSQLITGKAAMPDLEAFQSWSL